MYFKEVHCMDFEVNIKQLYLIMFLAIDTGVDKY